MRFGTPLVLLLLATIGVSVTAIILAWRERREPGGKPLVALLAGQTWWTVFLVFDLTATGLETKLMWANIRWVGVVIIPVAWLLFALDYTGRDQYIRPRNVALLAVIPAVTVFLAVSGEFHDLLYVESRLVEQGGHLVLDRTGGPWFWVIAGYTYLLGLLGAIPLLGLVGSDSTAFRGQSAAILIGIVAPWAINALFLLGVLPTNGVDPTPVGFAISGVAYLGAIKQFRLFETSPAPNPNARRLVFKRMQQAAIVVDHHDYVVDVNRNAEEILRIPQDEALGSSAHEVIPGYEQIPENGQTSEPLTIPGTNGNRFYDVTVTRITNFRDRHIGRLIIFHDIGEHLRQQQRLEVLNRVLRHNIRNETNIVMGQVDLLENGDEEYLLDQIREHTRQIEELANKARKIAEIFDREDDLGEAVSLDSTLRECVTAIEEEFPGVRIERDPPPEDVYVSGVLAPVFYNVIRNGVEHNRGDDVRVWIRTEVDGEQARVVVADNGPGIDESERKVLERGTETPLAHGSGLGLWLIKWGTSIADGRVTFRENIPTGSIVSIEVPILLRSDDAGTEREVIEAYGGNQ